VRNLSSAVARWVPYRVRDAIRPAYPEAARPWMQASFAQTGEDRIIAFLFREILGVRSPTYLDVGAYHPFHLSNTALLNLSGCRGINVEPDPVSFAAFRRHRPGDVNLNVGVGAEPGRLTFYRMSTPTLNTFSREDAERIDGEGTYRIAGTTDVEVRTVADILAEHWQGCPDLLSLDVEGGDVAILRTMPDWPDRPTVVCAETLSFAELGTETKVDEVSSVLDGLGYVPYAETYINTVFVLKERWPRRQ
jgi:FkbM family methyltransferase